MNLPQVMGTPNYLLLQSSVFIYNFQGTDDKALNPPPFFQFRSTTVGRGEGTLGTTSPIRTAWGSVLYPAAHDAHTAQLP